VYVVVTVNDYAIVCSRELNELPSINYALVVAIMLIIIIVLHYVINVIMVWRQCR